MNATTEHFGFAYSNPQSAIRNPQSVIRNPQSAIRNFSTGFTLVELMVSIAILTGIILIVSSLLANAQRAVGMSQDTIKADADARAAVDRMRADLAGLTNEGFLAIYTDTDDRQHLVFTAVGTYRSMTETIAPVIANAARIDYGLTGDDDKNVLWRRAFLLNGEGGATTHGDMEKISLADYGTMTRTKIDNALYNEDVEPTRKYEWPVDSTNWFNCFINTPSITLPPNSLSEVRGLWPYLVRPGSDLKIHWTDGTLNAGKIVWYGPDAAKKDSQWIDHNAAYQDSHLSDDVSEYDVEFDTGGERYCALWTYRKKDNWPAALRITFTLGTGETARTYEVIVDLPR